MTTSKLHCENKPNTGAVPHPRTSRHHVSSLAVCFNGLVAARVHWLHGPSPTHPNPLTHTPSHPYPGTMQTVSWKVAQSAVFWIGALQHEALPPGRVQQPRPPRRAGGRPRATSPARPPCLPPPAAAARPRLRPAPPRSSDAQPTRSPAAARRPGRARRARPRSSRPLTWPARRGSGRSWPRRCPDWTHRWPWRRRSGRRSSASSS